MVDIDRLRERRDSLRKHACMAARVGADSCFVLDMGADALGVAIEEIERLQSELDFSTSLVMRQGDLLTGVVNALRGKPPENVEWSHHDAPELAEAAARNSHRYLWLLQNARYGITERQHAVLHLLDTILAPDHIGGLSSAIDQAMS